MLRSLPSFSYSSLARSLSLPSSLLSALFSSLSVTMTIITRPVDSLCTGGSDLPVGVRGLRPIPCLANMFASCKKQLSWYHCASLVPLRVKWACDVSVLCVFVHVGMCWYVMYCVVIVVFVVLCVGCCTVKKTRSYVCDGCKKKKNEICVTRKLPCK